MTFVAVPANHHGAQKFIWLDQYPHSYTVAEWKTNYENYPQFYLKPLYVVRVKLKRRIFL